MRSRFDTYAAAALGIKLAAILVAIFLLLPMFVVLPVSFSETRFLSFPPKGFSLQWYHTLFSTPAWTKSALYSIQIAFLTMGMSLLLGLPAAFGLARANFFGKKLVMALFVLSLVMPVILIAMAEYLFLARWGLAGTTLGLVMAHTTLALPFVIIILVTALNDFNRAYERAALSLGANPVQTFLNVTFPLLRSAVIGAAALAALASLNEFMTSLFIVALDRSTLPIQFWASIRFELNPTIAAVSSIWLILSIAVLMILGLMRRGPKDTAQFRRSQGRGRNVPAGEGTS
jgi:putative spermidine/putrescine transport system permease protein